MSSRTCRGVAVVAGGGGAEDGVSWSSGRYGTTPVFAALSSMITLSTLPKMPSIVSRYMRLRVTSGAAT